MRSWMTLAEKLEDKETSLEDSFNLYKQGMELLKFCSDKTGYCREKDAADE